MSIGIPEDVIEFLKALPPEYKEQKISSVLDETNSCCFGPEQIIPPRKKNYKHFKVGRIPRPPNAFILYRQSKQSSLVEQIENLSNNEASKIIGQMWHNEPREEKDKWHALAISKKLEHMQKHPEYKYHPRRPSEKHRRKKKEKQEETASTLEEKPQEPIIKPSDIKDHEIATIPEYEQQPLQEINLAQFTEYNMQPETCFDLNDNQAINEFLFNDISLNGTRMVFLYFMYL